MARRNAGFFLFKKRTLAPPEKRGFVILQF